MNIPQSLGQALENQEGFELRISYALSLKHDLMGYFPAVFKDYPERIVLVLDKALLGMILKLLPPRKSQVDMALCYVHHEKGIAFPVSGRNVEEILSVNPLHPLTQNELEALIESTPDPFEWALGLVNGRILSPKAFERLLADVQSLP